MSEEVGEKNEFYSAEKEQELTGQIETREKKPRKMEKRRSIHAWRERKIEKFWTLRRRREKREVEGSTREEEERMQEKNVDRTAKPEDERMPRKIDGKESEKEQLRDGELREKREEEKKEGRRCRTEETEKIEKDL
ncbi:hypothetical protein Tco_1418568 [Tanacetum coccineum]